MLRLLIAFGLVQVALFAVRPAVTYRTLALGGDAVEVGIVAGSLGIMAIALAVPAGRWIDRLGETPFRIGGAAAVAASVVFTVLAPSVWVLAVSQVLLGGAQIVTILAFQASVANRAAPGRRERDFARLTIAVSAAAIVGPALLGILALDSGSMPSDGDVSAVLVVSALCAALSAVIGSTGPGARGSDAPGSRPGRRADRDDAPRTSMGQILRTPAVTPAIVVSVAGLTTLDLLTVYLPLYGERAGLTVAQVSALLTIRAVASLAARFGIEALLVRLGRRVMLVAAMALPGVLLLVLPLVDNFAVLVALVAVVGAALGLGAPLTLAVVSGQVPERARGTALGMRLGANRIGQVTLPVAVGALAGAVGVAASFVAMAAVLIVGTAAATRAVPPGSRPPGVAATPEPA